MNQHYEGPVCWGLWLVDLNVHPRSHDGSVVQRVSSTLNDLFIVHSFALLLIFLALSQVIYRRQQLFQGPVCVLNDRCSHNLHKVLKQANLILISLCSVSGVEIKFNIQNSNLVRLQLTIILQIEWLTLTFFDELINHWKVRGEIFIPGDAKIFYFKFGTV